MKIIQKILKIEEKFSDVQKMFRVGPKKVACSVSRFSGNKTIFFFFALLNLSASFGLITLW